MSEFFQEPAAHSDPFATHRWMRAYLRWKLPAELFPQIEDDLAAFGALCAHELWPLARAAEREPPFLVQYDASGRRVDELHLPAAWRLLRATAAQQGLVAIAYERRHAAFSRLHQFAKLFLFHPASAFYSCPVAMTDGAARILERFGNSDAHRKALDQLTSRDPLRFHTSGQWMTEREGGSDVARTMTQAYPAEDGFELRGVKFFVSAVESEIALALARKQGAPEGARSLTLFLARPKQVADGSWNGVRIRRLKDKLGTRALPTAEIELDSCPAVQIGEDNEGVRTVATMLNITRLHNSICAVAEATQALALLEDYSTKRIAFGEKLRRHPLQAQMLARLQVDLLAGFLMTMELACLLGRDETDSASAEDKIVLRVMTPVCKIVTGKCAVSIASDVVEGFGGAGYIEDVGVARHLRDAQVFPIWEGPGNVLALDMLRAIRSANGLEAFCNGVERILRAVASDNLADVRDLLLEKSAPLEAGAVALLAAPPQQQEASARDLAFHLAALYAACLALQWADAETAGNRAALRPWCAALAARVAPWRPCRADDFGADDTILSRRLT